MRTNEQPLRVSVVTGAGHGVGQSIAVRLAQAGNPLALVDLDESALAHTASMCRELGSTCQYWVRDVADAPGIDDFLDGVLDRFGAPSALYNAAGVMHVGATGESSVEDIRRVIETNLLGTVMMSRATLPLIARSQAGRVVNISSAFGLIGVGNYAAYSASKYGVRGFSAALRQEVGYGPRAVQVSCAVLGGIRTDIMRRATYAPGIVAADVQNRFDRAVARTTADRAAELVLAGVERGRAEFTVGADAQAVQLLTHLPERWVRSLVRRVFPAPQA